MIKLTVNVDTSLLTEAETEWGTVDLPSRFTTVVTRDDKEINRRDYAAGRNFSYSREQADMERPYAADVLQSIANRYWVQEVDVPAAEMGGAADMFGMAFCKNLRTYYRSPGMEYHDLWSRRAMERREELARLSDRELCEAIKAHFDSHPTKAGQKTLKTQAAEALRAKGVLMLPSYQRDHMVMQFSGVQIQEVFIERKFLECDLRTICHDGVITDLGDKVYRVDVQLQKEADGSVSVMADAEAGSVKICSLPDSFLHNNPMNVDRCSAEADIKDTSHGRVRKRAWWVSVVVNSDVMSGDVPDRNK